MPVKKLKLIANRLNAAQRLDQVLAEWLPDALARPVSKAKGRKLIMAGAVHVNGRPIRNAAKPITPGAVVEAFIDLDRLFEDSTSRDKKFELTPSGILLEDDDLIVIDKPPGIPSQPTVDESRDSLLTALRRFLSRRDGIEHPYVGVHHRLDRDTSGVVLFTKSRRVNSAMAEMFSRHRITKIYQALTVSNSNLPRQWIVRNRLGKISGKSEPARYGAVASGGESAETAFRVLAIYPRGIWIEATPKTGRTHQIRVHLAESGLPILGDDLYAPQHDPFAPRLMLHARQLTFPHPITGSELSIVSPLPRDFQQCLDRIRS